MSGCGNGPVAQDDEANGLRRSISSLNGVYSWSSGIDRYDYSKKAELEEILSAIPSKQAVEILIDCLDDISPSASVLGKKLVPMGVICYQGLSQLAYYEPTDESGDIILDWAGNISPKATPEEMRNAKNAWRKAQQANLLVFR